MGNVNMEATQVHVRNNSHPSWKTVDDALKALDNQDTQVQEDITELYTRDASRASKDDIAGEFSAEQAYYAGDYVYYEGSLFKFTEFHAAGEWSSEDVAPAQIGNDLANISATVDYSTTEQPTGQKWIDGKEIYFKTIDIGALPNASNKDVLTNITNIRDVVKIDGIATNGTIYTGIPHGANIAQYGVEVSYDKTNNYVRVSTSEDQSSYTGVIILYYTKTA